jgi:hypothetical protein
MITFIAALMTTMPVSTFVADDERVLFRPAVSLKDQSISLKAWGSGFCAETEEAAFQGTSSVRVATKNLFQGGTFLFGKPIDLAPAFTDKSNLLRITFKPLDSTFSSGSGVGGGGGIGAAGGGDEGGGQPGGPPSGGGRGGGGQAGGPPGGGFGQAGGGRGGAPSGGAGGGFGQAGGGRGGAPGGGIGNGGGGSTAPSVLKTIRLIVTTTDGKKSEAYMTANTGSADERGWRQASIPLQAIKGFEKTNQIVKSVSLAGDVSTAFYVGDMRTVSDKTPLRVEPNFRTVQCSVNSSVTFSANGFGGSSVLKYTWDFDDADGIQVDAEGQTVIHKFREASNDVAKGARPDKSFVVTLTVSDAYGLKESYSTKLKVQVNP